MKSISEFFLRLSFLELTFLRYMHTYFCWIWPCECSKAWLSLSLTWEKYHSVSANR